ncbi:MAG: class I SAM-dependent methyltransferase [Salibacteraceae bacterium]
MNKIFFASSKTNILWHPIAALAFFAGNKEKLHEKIILKSAQRLLQNKFDASIWKNALNEIKNEDYLPANRHDKIVVGNSINTMLGKWLYCSIRALKPLKIIETGIAHGSSSWVILNAINKNKQGRLYSLDLPNNDTNFAYNLEGKQLKTGWLVPNELTKNWSMIFGDTKETLPKLLEELNSIDYFFHDSDHSYQHMSFEFKTVFPFLAKEGLISSDDINKNLAFQDFVSDKKMNTILFTKGGSAIK